MNIIVKLFGPQSLLAGTRELPLCLENPSPTVADVRRALADAEPKLARSLANSRLAVNFEFADESERIHPGDEVALIGMICGG
jgi:molybdopterin converting factor small subunit